MQRKPSPVIIAATTDLFIQSRLNELASALGLSIQFASNEEELGALALSHPKLVILDLSSTDYDFTSTARLLKENNPPPKILGFYPHIRTDLEANARAAGWTSWFPTPASSERQERFSKSWTRLELDSPRPLAGPRKAPGKIRTLPGRRKIRSFCSNQSHSL